MRNWAPHYLHYQQTKVQQYTKSNFAAFDPPDTRTRPITWIWLNILHHQSCSVFHSPVPIASLDYVQLFPFLIVKPWLPVFLVFITRDAYLCYYSWVYSIDCPTFVTTDYGMTIESVTIEFTLFQKLCQFKGYTGLQVTAYRLTAIGMVDRLHRQPLRFSSPSLCSLISSHNNFIIWPQLKNTIFTNKLNVF